MLKLPIIQFHGKAYYLRDEAFNLLVDFSQYLYGSESITYENDHLKINGKHYQKTGNALQMLLYYNGIVIISLLILSVRFLISEETSTDCVNNSNCFTADDTNFTERITNCSEYASEKVICHSLVVSPISAIGFIGGLMQILPPLTFWICTRILLRFTSKGYCVKIPLTILSYMLLYMATGLLLFLLFTTYLSPEFEERILGKLHLDEDSWAEIISFCVLIFTLISCPWHHLVDAKLPTENEVTENEQEIEMKNFTI